MPRREGEGHLDERWLLIDIAHQGEVRLACVTPARPEIDKLYTFETASLPTFTDALLRFERESGQTLHGMNAIVAIAGAAVGDAIPVVRTRWNISRNGITLMLGRPVTILNDTAAKAWATIRRMPACQAVRGVGLPDFSGRSRHLFISMADGIGTAIIDVHDGHVTVLEAEAGHSDFAPQNDLEFALCKAIAPLGGPVTYEQVLIGGEGTAGAAAVLAKLSPAQQAELRGNILGRLASNLILASGAWSGVMLDGRSLPTFDPATRRAFDAGFVARKSFRRLINAAPCWRIEQQREAVLAGAATLMLQRTRPQGT
ncbi:Glucokinase [Sphingomonas guangdongensis]|uniref:Glucokinase n=2 Tax=Sphingomonas guangdongensis TaxID=1141890 RepID=A0A285QBA0_9SPHN|nr:Glucokinase [Sphingomonas guangdongensis]